MKLILAGFKHWFSTQFLQTDNEIHIRIDFESKMTIPKQPCRYKPRIIFLVAHKTQPSGMDKYIVHTKLYLLPPISQAQLRYPHKHLDWFQRYLWLKVEYALTNGITHFVDDDLKVLQLFERFAPGIEAFHFEDRYRLLKGMGGLSFYSQYIWFPLSDFLAINYLLRNEIRRSICPMNSCICSNASTFVKSQP